MSNSDLHTTAISTGGTSFDTATCIGGKCEYPLIESGVNAKVYYHNMICTQNKYEKLPLNTTLETYNASTKPNGGKPERSPFDDDATASYVGDFNINPMGNGLVSFQRVFAQVPEDHIEPYGLYSRQLPSYTVTGFTANNTDFDSLELKEQYSTDGANWVDRTTASLGDNKIMGSTIDGDTSVTVNDATLDWTNYTYVRLQWKATYTGSVATISDGTIIDLNGGFDGANMTIGSFTSSPQALTNYKSTIYIENRSDVTNYNYYSSSYRKINNSQLQLQTDGYAHSAIDLGDLIVRSTSGTTGNKEITATTPPYNLAQWHTETTRKDFGGIFIGVLRYYASVNTSTNSFTYHYIPMQNNGDSGTSFELPSYTRSAGTAENCPAHISYTYVRTDEPENIILKTKDTFPSALSSTTSPTADEYLASQLNNEYFNAENQFIERYMGNIYRLGQIRTIAL